MYDSFGEHDHVIARKAIPRPRPGRIDVDSIVESFANQMTYQVAKDEHTATYSDVYRGLAYAVRNRMMERWFRTQSEYYERNMKRVYYLSLEFLMGRALGNNIINLGAYDQYREAMDQLGYSLEDLQEQEFDAGLGNGGLGRLAACFLESAATLGLPFYGYGIRYEYGIFRQHIVGGSQVEAPDNWLRYGNPWEIPRPDALFPIKFYGKVSYYKDENGQERVDWVDTENVYAMAYDMMILGYRNDIVNTLRLWAAKSSREFDLTRFNEGDYVRAVEDKNHTENISKVLYPPDDKYAGKELRLKQQYFFVSATLQDMIRRFRKKNDRWDLLPEKAAVQLNDTHPAVAIPELMRVLVDDHRVEWDDAWAITQKVFGYTNHTVLPEALENWPIEFFGRLLPRHLQIIEEIDRRLRVKVRESHPHDDARVRRMAVIDDEFKAVRMANLAIVGSHSVNGVAKLHSTILRKNIFNEFDEMFPGRFNNKTNGITPRRWLLKANPRLAALITEAIGKGWLTDIEKLHELEKFVEDAGFIDKWQEAKRANKHVLADCVKKAHNIQFDPHSLLDCHVKRIHEYKRQLLNVLHVIALYHRIRDGQAEEVPRTVLFAGKAAPSYFMAKLVIRLIHAVGDMVAADPLVRPRLSVVFVPNYSVSSAEKIFPAAELSEQISTAGTEASGTGNMKAALNGALTIGTLDGANIEIREEVGEGNIFIFGHTAGEIAALRGFGYRSREWIESNAELKRVIETISHGPIAASHPGVFDPLVNLLTENDRYFHCADFASYLEAQSRAEETYLRQDDWTRMSIRNVANMAYFSSDRTLREYAQDIWGVVPLDTSGWK
jgi:starch phosphorylase